MECRHAEETLALPLYSRIASARTRKQFDLTRCCSKLPGGRSRSVQEPHHAVWRIDVLHRLLDGCRRTGPGAGGTRVRIGLGAGTLAYPGVAAIGVPVGR